MLNLHRFASRARLLACHETTTRRCQKWCQIAVEAGSLVFTATILLWAAISIARAIGGAMMASRNIGIIIAGAAIILIACVAESYLRRRAKTE